MSAPDSKKHVDPKGHRDESKKQDPSKPKKAETASPLSIRQKTSNQPLGESPEASADRQWKGKGKESSLQKGIPPFPSNKVGFGRPPGKTDPQPPDEISLLQLLSCREFEKIHPHFTQQDKKVEFKKVTKSKNYPITDVRNRCRPWEQFTFQRMLEDFPLLYQHIPRPDELGPESPGFWFSNESQFHSSLDTHLLRYVRQYLRLTFVHLGNHLDGKQAVPVTLRNGGFTREIRRKEPDIGVYELKERDTLAKDTANQAAKTASSTVVQTAPHITPPVNRMVIEVKPSSKWRPIWWNHHNNTKTDAAVKLHINDEVFFAPLAQTHFYMLHTGDDNKGTRYGAILTDEYLVPLYRPGKFGHLQVGNPIRWDKHFGPNDTINDFTIQSALWYLSMLSSLPSWNAMEESPGNSDDDSDTVVQKKQEDKDQTTGKENKEPQVEPAKRGGSDGGDRGGRGGRGDRGRRINVVVGRGRGSNGRGRAM